MLELQSPSSCVSGFISVSLSTPLCFFFAFRSLIVCFAPSRSCKFELVFSLLPAWCNPPTLSHHLCTERLPGLASFVAVGVFLRSVVSLDLSTPLARLQTFSVLGRTWFAKSHLQDSASLTFFLALAFFYPVVPPSCLRSGTSLVCRFPVPCSVTG